jgi:hypothetical protein
MNTFLLKMVNYNIIAVLFHSSNYFNVYMTNFTEKVFTNKLTAAVHQFFASSFKCFQLFSNSNGLSTGGFTTHNNRVVSSVIYRITAFSWRI